MFEFLLVQRKLRTYLNGGTAKIDACKIKEAGKNTFLTGKLDIMDTILQTRLPDESFRGLLNLIKTFRSDVEIGEIEKALVSWNNKNTFEEKGSLIKYK